MRSLKSFKSRVGAVFGLATAGNRRRNCRAVSFLRWKENTSHRAFGLPHISEFGTKAALCAEETSPTPDELRYIADSTHRAMQQNPSPGRCDALLEKSVTDAGRTSVVGPCAATIPKPLKGSDSQFQVLMTLKGNKETKETFPLLTIPSILWGSNYIAWNWSLERKWWSFPSWKCCFSSRRLTRTGKGHWSASLEHQR